MRRLLRTREAALLAVVLLVFAVMSAVIPGFFDAYNLLERTRYWAAAGILAVPMTFVIATGGIDLSVGSLLALCGIVMGLLFRDRHWPMPAAAGAALVTGAAAGALNGWVVAFLRVPALVVTLATMAMLRGIAMGLSEARAVSGFPEWFLWLGQGSAVQVPFTGAAPVSIPVPLVVLLGVYAAGWLVLHRSWVGRFTELMGENETAARFAAIDVKRLKLGIFTAGGLLCGLAAMVHTTVFATAKADTALGMELEAVTCVVIGGTRISGGHASIVGTFLGLLLLGFLRFGLEMAGRTSQEIIILVGLVLVVTAILNERIGGGAARRA